MKLLEYWIAKGLRVAIHDDYLVVWFWMVGMKIFFWSSGQKRWPDFCRRFAEEWLTTIDTYYNVVVFSLS